MKKEGVFRGIVKIIEHDDRNKFDKFLSAKTRRVDLAMPYLGYGTYYDEKFVGVSNEFLRDILDNGTDSQILMLKELEERCPTSVMLECKLEPFNDSWFNYLCFIFSLRYTKGSYKEYNKGLFNGGYDDFIFQNIDMLWGSCTKYLCDMSREQLKKFNTIVLNEGCYKFSGIHYTTRTLIGFLGDRFTDTIDIEILEELCNCRYLVYYPNKILKCLLGFLRQDSFSRIAESEEVPKELLPPAFYFLRELERVDLVSDKFPKWFDKGFVNHFMEYLLPGYDKIDYWDTIIGKSENYKKGDKTWSGTTELKEYWAEYFSNNYSYYRELEHMDFITQEKARGIYNVSSHSYLPIKHNLKENSKGVYVGSVWYKGRKINAINENAITELGLF